MTYRSRILEARWGLLISFLSLACPVFAQEEVKPMQETTPTQKIEAFFNGLNQNTLDTVDQFYHPDATLIDPIGTIRSASSIKAYYAKMYENVTSIRFDFSDFYFKKGPLGEEWVGVWKMSLQAKNLNSGKPVIVDGNSVLKFNSEGQCIHHRDYFDMGAFIYEKIPLLKNVVGLIKDRLGNH